MQSKKLVAIAATMIFFFAAKSSSVIAQVYLQPAQPGIYSLSATPITGQWSSQTFFDFAGVRLYVKPASQSITSDLSWEIQYEGLQDGYLTLANFNASPASMDAQGYKQITFGTSLTQTSGVQALFYTTTAGDWLVKASPAQFNRFELIPAPEPSSYILGAFCVLVFIMIKAYRDGHRYKVPTSTRLISKQG